MLRVRQVITVQMVLQVRRGLQVLTVPMAQPDLLVHKGLPALVVVLPGQLDLQVLMV